MDIGAAGCNLLRPLPPGCVRGLAGSTKNNKLCTDQPDERCSGDLCICFPPQLTIGLYFSRLFSCLLQACSSLHLRLWNGSTLNR